MLGCICCRNIRFPNPPNLPIAPLRCKIPMKSVSFNSIIQNSLVNLSIIQEFQNQEQKPLEVQYTFPLSEEMVISSLRIHLQDGTVLKAKIKESEKAAEIYQDSISVGNTALLGELDENKKMTISIGNLAPGDLIKVEFIITFPMGSDESSWKMIVPDGFLPSEFIDPIGFSFSVQIIASKTIQNYSSSVNINWNLSPDKLKLLGESQETVLTYKLNHALWVKYKAEDSNKPTLLYQSHEDKFFALVSFIPFSDRIQKLDEAEGQGEYIFVLDRSGSMGGDRIEMAKKATILFLKSLPPNSYFNIVSFGSTFENMFPESRINSSQVIDETMNKVLLFNADLGGTNIYSPLSSIFDKNLIKNYSRTIFLITDGEVENSDMVIQLIMKNSDRCRVHSFGIGSSFDRYLIKNSAKAGKGCCNFIQNNDEIGQKVISALMKSIVPCVSQWGISLQGESYPMVSKIGNVYYGERFVQYYLLDKIPNDGIVFKYFDDFEKRIVESHVGNLDFVEGNQIFKLWAKMKIEHLSIESGKNSEIIKNLSIRAGIPSSLTSFICVKENEEPVVGELVSKVIKIQEISDNQVYHQPLPVPGSSMFMSSMPLNGHVNRSLPHPAPPPMLVMPPLISQVFGGSSTSSSIMPSPPPQGFGMNFASFPNMCLQNTSAPVMASYQNANSSFNNVIPGCLPPNYGSANTFGASNNPQNANSLFNNVIPGCLPPNYGSANTFGAPNNPQNSNLFSANNSRPPCLPSIDLFSSFTELAQPKSSSFAQNFPVNNQIIERDPLSSAELMNQKISFGKPVPKAPENFNDIFILGDSLSNNSQPVPQFDLMPNQMKLPEAKIPKINYMIVITMQKAEGYWVLNEVSQQIPEVKSFISNLANITNNENEACTIFILGYLEAFFEDKRPEWLLVMRKAVNWLKSFNIDYNSIKSSISPLFNSN